MIEHWHACFETARHGRPIDLDQNVIGQEAGHVLKHHGPRGVAQSFKMRRLLGSVARLLAANDNIAGVWPARGQFAVEAIGIVEADDAAKFMQLVAWQFGPQALGQNRARQRRKSIPLVRRQSGHEGRCSAPKGAWNSGELRPQAAGHLIAVIAAEQFISAITRQRDRHFAPRHLADEERWNLRAVGERLAIDGGQSRNHVARLVHGDVKLSVVGSEVARDGFGVLCFVVAALIKADRERFNRPRAHTLHEGDDGRGIDAA